MQQITTTVNISHKIGTNSSRQKTINTPYYAYELHTTQPMQFVMRDEIIALLVVDHTTSKTECQQVARDSTRSNGQKIN